MNKLIGTAAGMIIGHSVYGMLSGKKRETNGNSSKFEEQFIKNMEKKEKKKKKKKKKKRREREEKRLIDLIKSI